MVALRDYLATRRTIPANQLGAPGPDDATLHQMLTIAARVPDHGKLAPWRFVVVAGTARGYAGARIGAMAQGAENPEILARETARWTDVPVVVVVVSTAAPHAKIPEVEQVLSAGAVCLNLIHAAAANGFCAQWLTGWAAYHSGAKAVLGVADGEQIAGFIHIGTPLADPVERARPDVVALTTRLAAPADSPNKDV
ncbi:MAG: nitroreductase [Pseudomonadota bacterium]